MRVLIRLLLSGLSTRQLALLSSNAVPLLDALSDAMSKNSRTRAQHTLSREHPHTAFQEATIASIAPESAQLKEQSKAITQPYGIRIDPSARFVTLDLRSLGVQCNECESAADVKEEERHRRLEMTLASSWLRAHCTCSECVDQRSFQRRYRETFPAHLVDAGLISGPPNTVSTSPNGLESGDKLHYLNARLSSVRVNCELLEVAFQDGHKARFELRALHWMQAHSEDEWSSKRVLWDRHLVEQELAAGRLKAVRFEELLRTDDDSALRAVLEALVRYGATFVDGTPATIEATERAIRRVGNHVMRTQFGDMWSFKNEKFDHPDTAYASIPLSTHIDLCSRDASAGLFCLHALQPAPAGEGGETLVVDGFRAAENLRKLHPHAFALLTSIPVDYEACERSSSGKMVHLYRTTSPILQMDSKGQLERIRYNKYDFANQRHLLRNPALADDFYEAVELLVRELEHPRNTWTMRLSSGRLLMLDNWRVLHGRAGIRTSAGARVLCGGYVARDEWLSQARALGVLRA